MHEKFSDVYDVFMKHVDYTSWYKFLKNFIRKKGTVLDLGCGTGEFVYRFLKDDYKVIGIDLSEDMVKQTKDKIIKKKIKNENYEILQSNMIEFETKEEVDYIICNFDTINYLNNEVEFIKFLEKCKKNLKKDGLLIFDAVSEEIFDEIFDNGIFLDEEPEYTSIWRYEQRTEKKYFVEIDLFVREDKNDNLFRKYNEQHFKYIYDFEWIIEKAFENGFEIIDTASNPDFGESRLFFIFKKI